MHIRHVVRQFHPAVGGLEEAVANLASALQRMPGIETSVVTLDRAFSDRAVRLPREDTARGVPVTRIPFTGSKRYPLAPSVLSALRGADIVHVHAIDFFFDFLAATRPIHRRPLVASTHGGFFHTEFAGRLKRAYFGSVTRLSARGYARIFGSSESDSVLFRRIAADRTVTIENGVDIAKWRSLGAPAPTRTLIAIGRFSVNKAIPRLFPLLAALNAVGEPWHLIVVGSPSDLSVADLTQAADAAGVADAVTIVTGADTARIGTLIGRAGYLVSASRYEGFGLTAVEGLSAGLTPLLSDIPPFASLVRSTERGVTLDFDDPVRAATTILGLHATLAPRWAAERERNIAASERYGWDAAAARFAAQYRAVLNGEMSA